MSSWVWSWQSETDTPGFIVEEMWNYPQSKSYSKARVHCKNALRKNGSMYRAPLLAWQDWKTTAPAQGQNAAPGREFVCLFAGSCVDRKGIGRQSSSPSVHHSTICLWLNSGGWKDKNTAMPSSWFPPTTISMAERWGLHIRLLFRTLLQNPVCDPPRRRQLPVHCKKQRWQHYQRNDSAFSCIHDLFPRK